MRRGRRDTMYHTATIGQFINFNTYKTLTKMKGIQFFDGVYHYKALVSNGLDVKLFTITQGIERYYIQIRVNFSKLLQPHEHIKLAQERDNKVIVDTFNNLVKKINLLMPTFDTYIVSRLDYTMQIYDLSQEQIELYIKLLNKGDHTRVTKLVADKNNNYTRFRRHSLYTSNKSITVNIYDKHNQLSNYKNSKYSISEYDIEQAKGILRIEIQCKKGKLEGIKSKHNKISDEKITTKNIHRFINAEMSKYVIQYYLKKIGLTQDYVVKSKALSIIDKSHYRQNKKDNLKELINELSQQYASIDKLKSKADGKEKAKIRKNIKAIEELGVNPVTINDRSKIRRLTNLLVLSDDYYKHNDIDDDYWGELEN